MNEFTLERRLHNVNSVASVLSKFKTQVIVKVFTLRKSLRNEKFTASVLQKAENLGRHEKMHTSKGSRKYSHRRETGAPNDGFLLNALKTLFRLSRVLLDL